MLVFITWSGDRSRLIARSLADWFRKVIRSAEPWLSDDMDAGVRWNAEIVERLATCDFGIVCLTRENLHAPWLHFEAGALAKTGGSHVCVVSLDVDEDQIPDTLKQFSATNVDKAGFFKLAHTINGALSRRGIEPLNDVRLRRAFESAWPAMAKSLEGVRDVRGTVYPVGNSKGPGPYQGILNDIAKTTLDRFQGSATKHLDVLGHSLKPLFATEGGRRAILTALRNGATVRIVFLDPTSPHSDQLAQVTKAMGENIKQKILESMERARRMRLNLRTHLQSISPEIRDDEVDDAVSRLRLAASKLISYVHLQRADDAMLVSNYSQSDDPGENAPTRELLRALDGQLFAFYEAEFARFWESATPIEEILSPTGLVSDRSRILTHLDHVQRVYRSVAGGREPLPPPRMLVVLPNMACSIRCPSCFTWNTKTMGGKRMSVALFDSLIRQAKDLNVSCLELTGGGEPLEHPDAARLLEKARAARDGTLRVGLLSNGLQLARTQALLDSVAHLDYVRLGFTEHLDQVRGDEEVRFFETLHRLGERRAALHTTVRIGVKLLLTQTNSQYLVGVADRLLRLKLPDGAGLERPIIDHIKVKSIRGDAGVRPTIEVVRAFEHMLVDLKARVGEHAADVQIDVKPAEVAESYRCWISPIMTVVDAAGDVYLCCNFYQQPEKSLIGSLGKNGEHDLSAFWGGPHHRAVMSKVDVSAVCNSKHGCHCRLVHYQELVEPYLPYADREASRAGTFFDGHGAML